MSGPYGGALFSATTYDASVFMFLLECGIMSSENYEDWSWFLEKLKTSPREGVVIISGRHLAFLLSVPKIFGAENHAYCYQHLKENFSTIVTTHNTRGNKGKNVHFKGSIVLHMHVGVKIMMQTCLSYETIMKF